MASPNSTFTELVTTTFRNHRKELADNVTNNNSLLKRLNQKAERLLRMAGYQLLSR